MKKLGIKGIVMVMGFLVACMLSISSAKAQGSVSFQVFYDELQPYGTWIHHNRYGYVWMPRVERGFAPYATNGYWINTEYGNTWVSDYAWGWAPFHYGRWFYDDFYGWMWVPDYMWGPAWVVWRSGGGYYGWAPMMPGFGFSVSYNYYSRIPNYYWSFVPHRYITYRSVYRHCVPRPHVVNIINNTTIITNNYTDNRSRTYFTGPSRREIERTTRGQVRTYSISDQDRPGRTAIERDRVSFYKPEIDASKTSRSNAMPSRYMRENGKGKLEQVEARRERTSEDFKQRNLQNDLRSGDELRTLDRNDARTDQRGGLEEMERTQQREMQRENEAFERFQRERGNSRDAERSQDLRDQQRSLQQRENNMLEEQRRSNSELRRQQLEKNNEVLREQRGTELRDNSIREEQRRSNGNEMRGQQFEKQNEMLQQQRDLQRQRDNAVREQQQRNDNIRREQFERQNSQREFSRPEEMRRMERKPQSLQNMERSNQNKFSQPNSNFDRQRSGPQQEIRRGTFDQKGQTPSRGNGGGNAQRRRT